MDELKRQLRFLQTAISKRTGRDREATAKKINELRIEIFKKETIEKRFGIKDSQRFQLTEEDEVYIGTKQI